MTMISKRILLGREEQSPKVLVFSPVLAWSAKRLRFRGKPNLEQTAQGVTLTEALIATIMFGVAAAVVLPLLFSYQNGSLKNELKLGAVAVTQQILDDLRRVDVTTIPSSGTFQTLSPPFPATPGRPLTNIAYLGKNYRASVTYCQRTPSPCDANTRQIQVDVFQAGGSSEPIYSVETLFTKFETPAP